jgi:flagellar protein FliS
MAAQRYGQYKAAAVEQADPVRLVGMLYEGALRFVELGRRGIAEGDAEGAHNAIMRAYAIVAELLATLDFKQGGEIAPRLEQLYDYVLHLLREANLGKDRAKLDQAESVLRELAGAWEDAFRKGGAPAGGSASVPLASAVGRDAPATGEDAGRGARAPSEAADRDVRSPKKLDLEV